LWGESTGLSLFEEARPVIDSRPQGRKTCGVSQSAAPALTIRAEQPKEGGLIGAVVAAAFSHHLEVADLVDVLRQSPVFIPELSLVAVVHTGVVGHVLLTRAELVDDELCRHPVLVLSPLSVLPQQQRQGIGSALVRCALHRADAMAEGVVVLQGSPRYYPRFGFRDSRTLGISMRLPDWAPPKAGMACPLSAYKPSIRGWLVESQPFLDIA
jgi:putative acetyltransferase